MTVNPPKVLIVEDDETWQGIWTRHLEREGATVSRGFLARRGGAVFPSQSRPHSRDHGRLRAWGGSRIPCRLSRRCARLLKAPLWLVLATPTSARF